MTQIDETDIDAVRDADEATRAKMWLEWVEKYGASEASRRWLEIFAAIDAPRTG
jgi:hypothetical protein